MRLCLAASLFVLAAAAARAEPVGVTVVDRPGYGRVTLKLPVRAPANTAQTDDRVAITLPKGAAVPTPERIPRNVLAFAGGDGAATMTLLPGARLHVTYAGRSVILDVRDPAKRPAGPTGAAEEHHNPAADPPPTAPVALEPAPTAPTAPVQPEASPPRPAALAAEQPAPQAPAAASPAEPPPVAAPVPGPAPPAEAQAAPARPDFVADGRTELRAVTGPMVGVAAFRRANLGVIVFDDLVDVETADGAAWPDDLGLQKRGGATVVTLPLGPDETLALDRTDGGWTVATAAGEAGAAPLTTVADGIAVRFPSPGRTVTIADPVTGQLLLVGTLRRPGGDTRIAERRAAPGFTLLPTWFGLAAEVTSDLVDLRVAQAGFVLQTPERLAVDPALSGPARQSLLPLDPVPVLLRRLDAQIAGAALAPPRERGRERLAAARTMLALGMAAEAQALLQFAAGADPALAADPDAALLTGMAAVLAGRPTEAGSLDAPDLPASKVTALWRGLRDTALGKASPVLASTWSSLSNYPAPVRDRITPAVMEAAVAAGAAVPLSELSGPKLAFARALALQRAGQAAEAAQAFDEVASSRDERTSVRASVAAAELRLAAGTITPAAAADLLERQAARWRGDPLEASMRLRMAELRRRAGQWRAALTTLKDVERLFPERAADAAAATGSVFGSVLAADDTALPALDLVAIMGDFADRLPAGALGDQLALRLADKLAALDLPSRALPVLQRLAERSQTPAARAEFSLRLAPLQLEAGDARGALALLSGIDPALLPPALAEERALAVARARAALGELQAAAAELERFDTARAAELRAELLGKGGDWPASLAALQQAAGKSLPATGPLTETQQGLLLREATAAVHADDAAALSGLRRYEPWMTGSAGDLFKVLTATAISTSKDLSRAKQELATARALPERLHAFRAP